MTIPIALAERARANLTYIVDRWPDLRARLRPTAGNALTGLPAGTPDPPLPIDVHISDLMRAVEDEARALGYVLLDETVDWAPATSVMPGLLRDVTARYGHWTAGDERAALDFCDWAEEYAAKVQHALERPAPPEYVGPCRGPGTDGTPGECPGDLYLRPGTAHGKCRACGTGFARDEQAAYVEEMMRARLVTQAEGWAALSVLQLNVSRSAVKMWVHRGRLEAVVLDPDLYRLSDIIDLGRMARPRRHSAA